MIRTEIDLTDRLPSQEFFKAIQRIDCAYNKEGFLTTVHIESGDLTDEIHRLVFATEIVGKEE